MEVETIMMCMLARGATAKPFVTHHNDLNLDLYLRIAHELYLSRCLLWGNRIGCMRLEEFFRIEGIDLTHSPEFTICGFYMAYADMEDVMDLTEVMVEGMVKFLTGGKMTVIYHPDWNKGHCRRSWKWHSRSEISCIQSIVPDLGFVNDLRVSCVEKSSMMRIRSWMIRLSSGCVSRSRRVVLGLLCRLILFWLLGSSEGKAKRAGWWWSSRSRRDFHWCVRHLLL